MSNQPTHGSALRLFLHPPLSATAAISTNYNVTGEKLFGGGVGRLRCLVAKSMQQNKTLNTVKVQNCSHNLKLFFKKY